MNLNLHKYFNVIKVFFILLMLFYMRAYEFLRIYLKFMSCIQGMEVLWRRKTEK
jgi:hypothetical protein